MARVPRRLNVQENHSVHKVWSAHNKDNYLESSRNKKLYTDHLNDDLNSEKFESGVVFHAMTLMSNHTHEIYHIKNSKLFSGCMRRHHSRFGSHFNKLNNRCGSVGKDRPYTTLIENDYHEMIAVFYVHANPLRARMVKDMRYYFWSTHRLYAYGVRDDWTKNIKFPKWYLKLGKSDKERRKEYLRLFNKYLQENGLLGQKENTQKNVYHSLEWLNRVEKRLAHWRVKLATSLEDSS